MQTPRIESEHVYASPLIYIMQTPHILISRGLHMYMRSPHMYMRPRESAYISAEMHMYDAYAYIYIYNYIRPA